MALSDSYFDLTSFKAMAKKTVDVDDAQLVEDGITISRWLDKECGRAETGFNEDESPVVRVFRTPGTLGRGTSGDWPYVENPYVGMRRSPFLITDDMAAAPTLVRVDYARNGTYSLTLEASQYSLMPLNAPLRPMPSPYYALQMIGNTQLSSWPADMLIEITAKWGWPGGCPSGVINLVHEYVRIWRVSGPRATLTVEHLDALTKTNPECAKILSQVKATYKRRIDRIG